MKFILVAAFFFFVGLNIAVGQEGAQRLRLAQSVYEQGRLHELPDLLKDTEVAKFSKSEQVSAYKLLTLAHIYLEEPEKADESMLKLLNTEHFFEPNKDVDPAEFIGLYNTFRHKPVFNIGFKFGANSTIPMVSDVYYVASGAAGKGKYGTPLSIQGGLVFEKEIFSNSKNKILTRLTFAPEVLYAARAFAYTNDNVYSGGAKLTATIKQTWIDFNPLFQFKMNKSKTLQTYLVAGPGISYILNGALGTPSNSWDSGAGAVSGADVDNKSSYKKLVPSVMGGAGLKFKFGEVYLLAEGRVQYGLVSPVNPSSRTNSQSVFEYGYTLPDYKPLTLMANIGIVYPYFNPIKLKRK